MASLVTIDPRDIAITPVFKYVEVENIPKSEAAGHLVMETKEMVEVRFAGSKNYSPMFPAHGFWKREGNRTITYAERWAEQYRAFKEGSPQEAMGTPLEMLHSRGIPPELTSLCRALKIYSIEALHQLEGSAMKSLGMNANRLKQAAADFMAERQDLHTQADEIEKLKAQIEALKAGVPVQEATPEEIAAAEQAADEAIAKMSDDQIKEEIAKLAGSKPRGNPSRDTLVSSLKELQTA